MKIEDAKQIDMVDYLSKLGYHPAKIIGKSYWYHSPLHEEKTPSFKINRQMNRWYDFSEGVGGNLVDFGIRFHHCDVKQLLEKLNGQVPVQALQNTPNLTGITTEEDRKIQVVSSTDLRSLVLLNYLQSRGIEAGLGKAFLHEVNYQIGGNRYYALGFKNDSGGYELRNKHFKGSSSPKDTRFIDNGSKDMVVFEGFFNFLSYLQMHGRNAIKTHDVLVLNTASFFEKSIPLMQLHERNHLYLDNDATGNKHTQLALTLNKLQFTDERKQYQQYNDLNDWLVKQGQQQKPVFKQKP